jgi:hypothetical protein
MIGPQLSLASVYRADIAKVGLPSIPLILLRHFIELQNFIIGTSVRCVFDTKDNRCHQQLNAMV